MKRLMLISAVLMVTILIGYPNQAYTNEEVITLKIANHHGPTMAANTSGWSVWPKCPND